jgi:hypothetical protein
MPKVTLPGQNEPLVLEGGLINPVWYEKLIALAKVVNSGLMGAIDVELTGPAQQGQFLVYRSANGKFVLEPPVSPTVGQTLVWDAANQQWTAV